MSRGVVIGRVPWPPMLLVLFVAGGVSLNSWHAFPGEWPEWAYPLGWFVIALGVALFTWAVVTMWRARTNILPTKGADRLLTHGPFALSRNPIYLADLLLLVGAALVLGSGWILLLTPIFVAAVHFLAIRREEAHLAEVFPESWSAYRDTVGRWIGPV